MSTDMTPASSKRLCWLLLAPALALYAISFLTPVVRLLLMSFRTNAQGGVLLTKYTVDNYLNFFVDAYSWSLVLNSLGTALLVTLLTLLCAYPIAMLIHRTGPRWRNLLIIVTISPLLVSSVVRTYGWMLLLGDAGVINGVLKMLGLINGPIQLINNMTGVVIGLVEILMPYMALSLLAGFGKLEQGYEDAAASLGAGAVRRFFYVTLPLTAPGMALGSLLCFVLSISAFVTPSLLGGGRAFLLATEIYDQAVVQLQWPLAATLSVIMLVIFTCILKLYSGLARRFA